MKLLIATPLYPPELGGPATYSRILEQELPKNGMDVTLVKFSDVRALPKVLRHFAYFWKVYRAAKSADMVLAIDPVSVGLPALLATRLAHRTFLVKIVGDYAWEQGVQRFGITDSLDSFSARMEFPLPVRILRSIEKYVARGARTVLVPSEYLKRIVGSWGIPEEKIEVVYNAAEIEEIKENGKTENIYAEKSDPSLLKIITVGRLVPWKHVEGVIEAVSQLSTTPLLTVVGDGPERTNLEKLAKARLGDRSHFTGALSHSETLNTIAYADMLVLNSSYEGLSHVLIEALMLGKVVIATNVGGNPELIQNGVNGGLVPVGDTAALTAALENVLQDAALRERLSSEAQKAKETFSKARMIEKTIRVLNITKTP